MSANESKKMSTEELEAKLATVMALLETQNAKIAELQSVSSDTVKVLSAPIQYKSKPNAKPSQPFVRLERFSMGRPKGINIPLPELERVISEMKDAASKEPVVKEFDDDDNDKGSKRGKR